MRIPLTIKQDHLLLALSPGPWILDTGSPVSISEQPVFLMGSNRPTRRSLGHANLASIRAQTGVDAIGLLGNDHLGSIDTYLDLMGEYADFSNSGDMRDYDAVTLSPISSSSLHSVDVHVEGLGIRRMLLDTGAKYSYIDSMAGARTRQLGAAKDFQFAPNGMEQLDIELHHIHVRLGKLEGAIRCATHPDVTARLKGTDAVGILGWDILKYGRVLYSPRRGLLGTRATKD